MRAAWKKRRLWLEREISIQLFVVPSSTKAKTVGQSEGREEIRTGAEAIRLKQAILNARLGWQDFMRQCGQLYIWLRRKDNIDL